MRGISFSNRNNLSNEARVGTLPAGVQAGVLNLVASYGLIYAGVDLVLTKDGEHIFLEINPSGQWAWLEDRLSFPIRDTLIDWMTE